MKKYFPVILIFSILAVVMIFSANKVSSSSAEGNILGWDWSGSINDAENGCSISVEDCGNLGWFSLSSKNDPANTVQYGVTIPDTDGPLIGEAWSSNVGWVNFQPVSGFPNSNCSPSPCPQYGAQRIGNNFSGWALIESFQGNNSSQNTGGAEGWIKMSGVSNDGTDYGVVIDPITGIISGKAWSGEIGWIEFDGLASTTSPNPPDEDEDEDDDKTGIDLQSSCAGTPNPSYVSNGGKVSWKASVLSAGTPPYSYTWTFAPNPTTKTGTDDTISTTYDKVGSKSATVDIVDSVGSSTSATCNVSVLKTGKVKESIPR